MKPLIAVLLAMIGCGIWAAPVHGHPTPTPNPKSNKNAQAQLPVARPVPGMAGHVYSPYAKGKIIAVSGSVMGHPEMRIDYKHGEVVRCPYTGKMFRVR
jgi:hypothetical protein